MNNDVTMAGESARPLLANRYRIVRQLGQGGMGSVWLAEDTQLDNKLFAIKMLPSILVSNKRAYNQLKAEALVAMKLVHPNIVQIRAFEENNNNPFLVMDYVDGETLDDWLGNRVQELGVRRQESGVREVWPGRSPLCGAKSQEACERPREPYQESGVIEEDIVRLLKPIAEALDYAHAEGVVHRDIKPANVMIRKDGRPFIMDFGIAREIQETMTRVTGKMSSGTLMYMSPEQLNGDVPKPAQDVYSFAAMVYECLKGKPPFCRGNIEFQIMNKEPEPLTDGMYGPDEVRFAEQSHKRPASVPASRVQESGSIASSVMSGLAKKPEDRPKSCVAVLEGNYAKKEDVEENSEKGELGREDKKDGGVPASGDKRVSSRSVVILLGVSSLVFILVAVCSLFWFIDYNNEKDYAFTSRVKQLADQRDSPQTQGPHINDPEEAEEKSDSSGKGKPGSSVGAPSGTGGVKNPPRNKYTPVALTARFGDNSRSSNCVVDENGIVRVTNDFKLSNKLPILRQKTTRYQDEQLDRYDYAASQLFTLSMEKEFFNFKPSEIRPYELYGYIEIEMKNSQVARIAWDDMLLPSTSKSRENMRAQVRLIMKAMEEYPESTDIFIAVKQGVLERKSRFIKGEGIKFTTSRKVPPRKFITIERSEKR